MLPEHSFHEVVNELEAGIRVSEMLSFLKASGLPEPEVLRAMRMSDSDFRARRDSGRLSPEESERLLRLSWLFDRAIDLFEAPERASYWMANPVKALGGVSPLEMARTEFGGREVENVIGRLEDGVFS